MFTSTILATVLAVSEPTVVAEPLPAAVRAMIDAAIARDDPKLVASIIELARATNPSAGPEIEAIEAAYRTDQTAKKEEQERAKRERIEAASLLDMWKGQVELGGTRSTGSADSLGLYASVNVEREGIDWRHKLNARADFQETNDVTSTKRALLSWQPNYKIDGGRYAYGLAQYEYDPLLGYDSRYTLGGGIGYTVIGRPKLKLVVEGGPALRLTDPVAGPASTSLAARASLDLGWKIAPALEFKQSGAFYYERGDTSANAQSALDATLIGDLKARLSYNVQYERNAPAGTDAIDTTSRATLIYSF